jgi:hypothetical protein
LIFDIPETPQSSDYEEALGVTRDSLQPFLYYVLDDSLEFFALNSNTWGMTTQGPFIDFTANIKLIDGAEKLRDVEIMEQIQKGFVEESFLSHYVRLLQQLDPSNPFHQTKSVHFHSKYDKKHRTAEVKLRHHVSNTAQSSILSSFAGTGVLLGISCLIYQHCKRSQRMASGDDTKKGIISNENSFTKLSSLPLSWMPRYWLEEDDTVGDDEDDEMETDLAHIEFIETVERT